MSEISLLGYIAIRAIIIVLVTLGILWVINQLMPQELKRPFRIGVIAICAILLLLLLLSLAGVPRYLP